MSVLGAITDAANLGLSLVSARKNRDFAREQATTAYERQIELMNMQNSYNSPAAQMQRFVDAGLNPNLVYGQLQNGLSSPNVAQGAAVSSNPQIQLSNALLSKQMAKMDTDTQLQQQRLDMDYKESLSRIGVNDANAEYLCSLSTTVPVSIFAMEQQIALMSKQERSLSYDIMLKSLTMGSAVSQAASEAKLSSEQARNYQSFVAAQMLGLKAQARRDLSAAALNKEQSEVAKQISRLYSSEAYSMEQENIIRYQTYQVDLDGVRRNPAQSQVAWDLNRQQNQALFQQKMTQLIQKYGDSKEILGLIHLGTESVENLSNSVSNFGLSTRKSKSWSFNTNW